MSSWYACFCEVDRDCASVFQWCEACQARYDDYAHAEAEIESKYEEAK